MFKWVLGFLMVIFLMNDVFSKTLEQEVFAKKIDVTIDLSASDLLTLNGLRLIVTSELENLKLDSKLFWEKLEQKKLSPADELKILKTLFSDITLTQFAPALSVADEEKVVDEKLTGKLKIDLNTDKLKSYFDQVSSNLEETKNKTFYILADINLSNSAMSWGDLGVTKSENFSGVIVESWKKLVLKEFKSYEFVTVLEKEFSTKPDYMNSKSVTLKWNTTINKTTVDEQKKTASYELSAQYVLVNTKTGTALVSFDFPIQKRELSTVNKKALSSSLASLVYNLLLSQTQKIEAALQTQGTAERTSVEFKLVGAGLTDVYAVNNVLQEKLKDFKATLKMKSFSSDAAFIHLDSEGSLEQIVDKLSEGGGKIPLNEQKILLFNAASKSFAIIAKDSNN